VTGLPQPGRESGSSRYAIKTMFGKSGSENLQQPAQNKASAITLQSLASNLLHIAAKIQISRDIGSAQSVKKLLNSYFQKFENHCYKNNKHPDLVSQAKYAIAALMDESILNKGGDIHESWVVSPLTLELFNDPIGGENFFTRLEALMENPSKNSEVLDIYYLCLALGFRGKYHLSNKEQLNAVSDNILHALETVRGKASKILSPAPNTPPGKSPNVNPGIKFIIGTFSLLALSIVFYFALMTLSSGSNPIVKSAVSALEKSFYLK
jgi:type VI secretion system protein ImpK